MNEIQTEKLDRFVNSVNNEVDEKINKIISEAEIQKSHQMKKTEDEELLNAYNKIQKSVGDIELKYRRMLALKQQQLKTDSLRQRENLAQKIFDAVKKQICEFTNSEKYENYLLGLVKNEKVNKNFIIMISEKDLKYSVALHDISGCKVETDSDIVMGGILIVDTENGIAIDKTFDSAIEEQRKKFSSRYKFRNENLS